MISLAGTQNEEVDSILQFAASTPKPGEIVFTFANSLARPDGSTRASAIEQGAASRGEPWLTRFQPDDLKRKLEGFGFSEILFLTPEMIAERYFHDRRDLIVPGQSGIVSAKV